MGLGTTLHVFPSKCSMKVWENATVPTAQTSLVLAADTLNIEAP
jgi:hypothetical protein